MADRKELKGIAAGVLGFFVSRNNSVHGYWGMGKLYRHAQDHGTNTVVMDLLQKRLVPDDPEFTGLTAECSARFHNLLGRRGIPHDWVRGATLEVQFNVPIGERRYAVPTTWGDPFAASLAVTDDNQRVYQFSTTGWCAPHDPRLERRGGRG